MSFVRLEDVTKVFGEMTAVNGVSLDVKKGEFLSLLGPSGCGKTTTLRIIAGFERPTRGSVFIRDELVNNVPSYLRNTGMVFQNYALFPHKRVYDNVAFGLKYRHFPKNEIKDRVKRVLDLVQLPGLEERYPKQLSGGQQQRVALARALVIEPDVLLLDEPLSNLDAKLRAQMRIELKQIQQRIGITTIFVTHDQEESMTLSDRTVVMQKGSIIEQGEPYQLYEDPKSEFVASFIGQSNFMNGKIAEIGENMMKVSVDDGPVLTVPKQDAYGVGDSVTAFIRYERIEVLPAKPPDGGNVLSGLVDHVMFLGTNYLYRVAVSPKVMLIATEPNIRRTRSIVKGSTAWVRVEPENVGLIRKP
ncbi:MAG: ABC transporter ATP-binding protein [Candidatus Bathyarchaeia archaeon]